MKNHIIFLLLILINPTLFGVHQNSNSNDTTAIVLPGQNGFGGLRENFGNFEENLIVATKNTISIKTPSRNIDLGQEHCIQDFEKQVRPILKKQGDFIFYGVSQGTATMINWLSKQPPSTQKCIKALVLEAILANGNDTALHTIKSEWPIAKILVGASYWASPLIKLAFPSYKSWGIQSIKSVLSLPQDLPIIIIHAELDPQTPFKGALQMYNTLRENGFQHIYFFPAKNKYAHCNVFGVLDNELKQRYQIGMQLIYQKYSLPYNEDLVKQNEFLEKPVTVEEFQPNLQKTVDSLPNSNSLEKE